MYCGRSLATTDEFELFFGGVTIGLMTGSVISISPIDRLAIVHFPRFMRYHLHGWDKNCCWREDLVTRCGSDDLAVRRASALLCAFRDRLQAQGADQLEAIMAGAKKIRLAVAATGTDAEGNNSEKNVPPA